MNRFPRFESETHLAESLKTKAAIFAYEKLAFGAQIKKMRKKAGMKQTKFAKLLQTSQSAVARIEAGKQNLTLQTLIAVALVLGKKLHLRLQ